MVADEKLIKVRNRANGSVGYTLDNNFHRSFEHGETKHIPFKELKELQYAPGGDYALKNLLVIEDKEVLDYLNMIVEPEYFYTEDKIKDILFNGSMDAFADFLDFAPEGALDIAKVIAIKEEIPDVRKRDMLGEKIGLNINNAITINKIMDEDNKAEEQAPKKRRVAVDAGEPKTGAPKRRTAAPNYKVVSK